MRNPDSAPIADATPATFAAGHAPTSNALTRYQGGTRPSGSRGAAISRRDLAVSVLSSRSTSRGSQLAREGLEPPFWEALTRRCHSLGARPDRSARETRRMTCSAMSRRREVARWRNRGRHP